MVDTSDIAGLDETDDMDLGELRGDLEEIDQQIMALIARRTYVADTLATTKSNLGLPIVDEDQEKTVLNRAEQGAEDYDIDVNITKAIFRMLIELNKIEQREYR